MLDKIDWKRFVFNAEITHNTLFGNIRMAEAYHSRWKEVREMKDDFMLLERVIELWNEHYRTPSNRVLLRLYMIMICTRHFRKEVWGLMKDEIKPSLLSKALKGEIMLSQRDVQCTLRKKLLYPTASKATYQDLYFVTGNRMTWKELGPLVDFLWNYDDRLARTHWQNKGYRILYQRCSEAIRKTLGKDGRRAWQLDLKHVFVMTT